MSPLVYGPFNLLCGAPRGHFDEVRRPKREAIHSPPSRNDVKVKWHYSSTLSYDSKLWIGASLLLCFVYMGTLWYSSGLNPFLLHPLFDSVRVKICHKLQFCSQYICRFSSCPRNYLQKPQSRNVGCN
jgi:hypothetical protein